MLLITPSEWATKYFSDESRPSAVTIMRWLNQGKIPGKKVGGLWYVDEHAWVAGDDDLVQRVLEAG